MENTIEGSRERLDWISTISLAHVHRGLAGGFLQDDREGARLARLRAGDRIACYSPRTDHPGGHPLQLFTACGTVTGHAVAEVGLGRGRCTWRRAVRFEPCLPVPIREVLDDLGFITDARYWGIPFRRGLFAIPARDFDRIATAMRVGAAALREAS